MITDDQIKQIQDLSAQGRTANEIAAQLGITEKTVRKYKKAPAPLESRTGETSNTPDYSIDDGDLSSSKQDELKGRHYAFVVYPSENWIREHVPDCPYDGSSGWGEAPDDWIEQLQNTGLPFVVSPLHDKDTNPDGSPKKPHWHVIISWSNTTTYRNARVIAQTILRCPLPQLLKAVEGMYRYLTHQDNPEKHQYSEIPRCYNGWVRPLDNAAITAIMAEIRKLVYLHNCQEYGELVAVCVQLGNEYFDVVSSHTYFFDRLCASYRHAPLLTLSRVLPEYDADDQKQILELMEKYSGGIENESDNQ